jgi:glyceraldehyde-3-phosphate dehydrogenase type I
MITIAINGFGRIGRTFLRTILQDDSARKRLKVAVINVGPADAKMVAHMFKYDTIMGIFPGDVTTKNGELIVNKVRIKIIAECNPAKINWKKYHVDWVVECTGCFTHREGAQQHLDSGAKYVLISAPAKGEDVSIIPGVNQEQFDFKKDRIVSLGSCTTNAFATTLKVLDDEFGIKQGFMTTIHAYTNTQVLLDVESRGDVRRARAAAVNMIPSTTGASDMLKKIFPHLEGKIEAVSIRIPLAAVSLIDFVFVTKTKLSPIKINNAFSRATQKSMKGILDLSMEPLVSSDYIGNPCSVVIDGLMTEANKYMGKVFGWYDNEWGYSERMKDFLLYVSRKK